MIGRCRANRRTVSQADFVGRIREDDTNIPGRFTGQIGPSSPPSLRTRCVWNTADNPCGLLRYHVGPYVLARWRMPLGSRICMPWNTPTCCVSWPRLLHGNPC